MLSKRRERPADVQREDVESLTETLSLNRESHLHPTTYRTPEKHVKFLLEPPAQHSPLKIVSLRLWGRTPQGSNWSDAPEGQIRDAMKVKLWLQMYKLACTCAPSQLGLTDSDHQTAAARGVYAPVAHHDFGAFYFKLRVFAPKRQCFCLKMNRYLYIYMH